MLAGINILLMGLFVYGFAAGPFASAGQAWWYRGGSSGLLLAGGLGPALALATIARRSAKLTIALTLWMIVALVLLFGYAINSGGGV